MKTGRKRIPENLRKKAVNISLPPDIYSMIEKESKNKNWTKPFYIVEILKNYYCNRARQS